MNEAGSRFSAQLDVGHRLLRDDLEVWVSPGSDPDLAPTTGGIRIRASSPVPTIRFRYTGATALEFVAEIENAAQDALFVPTVYGLGADADCEGRDGQGLVLSPLTSASLQGTGQRVVLSLAPCSETIITTRRDPAAAVDEGVVRFGVIGEIDGNRTVLAAALDDMQGWEADFFVALGNLSQSASFNDLDNWRRTVHLEGLPAVVAIGEDELAGTALLPFHEVFGRSDFSFEVGEVGFYVMDTASAGISEAQFDFWETVLSTSDSAYRFAFMQTPPFDPSGIRDRGFRSRHEAARLVSLLGSTRVDYAFTGRVGTFATNELGGVNFLSTGGGGGPIESNSAVGNHYLRVTVDPNADPTINVEVQAIDSSTL